MSQPGDINLPAGHRLIHHAQCASTNEEGLTLAKTGEQGPVWIVADSQTQGRGRQQRQWVSIEGNLHTSCVITPACDPAHIAQLGFVAGLACYQAASEFLGSEKGLTLKWPNDLLLGDKKTAGLLLERPGDSPAVVIGFGVNVAGHPDGLAYPTTHLRVQVSAGDRFDLLEALARGFDHWLQRWDNGTGFADIREAWSQRAHGLGAKVAVDLGHRHVTGVFSGLDKAGAMILVTEQGTEEIIMAGDYLGLVS